MRARKRLDMGAHSCIVPLVNVPSLTLPSPAYADMQSMSNRHLVCLLRAQVLAPERSARFSPRPPAEHDAYIVRHEPRRISVHLFAAGAEVFCCHFVPPTEY